MNQKIKLMILGLGIYVGNHLISMDDFRNPFVGPSPLAPLHQTLLESGMKSSTFYRMFRPDELTPAIVNWVDYQDYPDLDLPVGTTLAHKLAAGHGYRSESEQEDLMALATEKGIDWNAQDNLGNTAAYYAARVASLPNLTTAYDLMHDFEGSKRNVGILYLAQLAPESLVIPNNEGKIALDYIEDQELLRQVEGIAGFYDYLLK